MNKNNKVFINSTEIILSDDFVAISVRYDFSKDNKSILSDLDLDIKSMEVSKTIKEWIEHE